VYVQHNTVYSRDDLLELLATKNEAHLEARQAQRWLMAVRGASLAGVALTGFGATLTMERSRPLRAIGLGTGIAGVTLSLGGILLRGPARDNARAVIDRHSQSVMLQPRDPLGATGPKFTPGSPLSVQREGGIIVQDDRVLGWAEIRQHLEGTPASGEAARSASRWYVIAGNSAGVAGAVFLASIPAVATASSRRDRAVGLAIFGVGTVAAVAGSLLAIHVADRRVERAVELYNGSLERPTEAAPAGATAVPVAPGKPACSLPRGADTSRRPESWFGSC